MKHAAKIREISKDELRSRLDGQKSFELINVLKPEGYNLGVIVGSKKIPLSELEKRVNELDKTKDVVTYCANKGCNASDKAAGLLADKGFKVSVYKGGAEEWSAAGFPVETPAATPDSKAADARVANDGCCGADTGAKE